MPGNIVTLNETFNERSLGGKGERSIHSNYCPDILYSVMGILLTHSLTECVFIKYLISSRN